MNLANAIRRPLESLVMLALIGTVNIGASAAELKVGFDFARQVSYKDITPADRAKQYPAERVVSVKLPISVRFAGFVEGEVEDINIEVDGSAAGLCVESFCPTTQLVTDAMTIETTTSTKNSRSLGGTLGSAIPVPVGAIVAQIAPSVSANATKSNEATEKIRRLPPKEPLVVSGTFAEGHGVFYKIKPSSQTSLEGVHELEIKFIAPTNWKGGSLRVTCVARGHRSVFWTEQPTIFGRAVENVALSPEGDAVRNEAPERHAADSAVHKASFFDDVADGAKRAVKSAFAGVSL